MYRSAQARARLTSVSDPVSWKAASGAIVPARPPVLLVDRKQLASSTAAMQAHTRPSFAR